MPEMDGHTFLETLKDDDAFRSIPIVVLSTSGSADDVFKSYQEGANSYIQKPSDLSGYIGMVKEIRNYWFEYCTLPFKWGHA